MERCRSRQQVESWRQALSLKCGCHAKAPVLTFRAHHRRTVCRKNVWARGWETVGEHAVFWKWRSYCAHQLKAAVVTRMWSSPPKYCIDGAYDLKAPSLPEEPLAVDQIILFWWYSQWLLSHAPVNGIASMHMWVTLARLVIDEKSHEIGKGGRLGGI